MSDTRSKPTRAAAILPPGAALPSTEWLGAGTVLAFASLAAVLPMLLHGPSCGHDFLFHLTNWIEAATQIGHGSGQIGHGSGLPQWAFSPAWNAGEPRFVFYPPASWLLGAFLLTALPASTVPAAFTGVVLLAAGLGLYRLARDYAPSAASLLASALYLAGPYALFTAYERSAYAELLAAAWLPLLLRAGLQATPSLPAVAIPLALLWLTNAPAAVMGTYSFALLLAGRLVFDRWTGSRWANLLPNLRRSVLGACLGLLLPAFYLVPAAFERRWVQIAMAVIPNMRAEDNFLFGGTGDAPHDAVLHTASLLAVTLLGFTAGVLAIAWRFRQHDADKPLTERDTRLTLPLFTALALTVAFLLVRPSTPLWEHVPEMAFLQFPWRVLAILSVVGATALALALRQSRLPRWLAVGLAPALALACGFGANHAFRQACEVGESPIDAVTLFRTHHGTAPTDEYTPDDADNDVLRWDDPGFWIADSPAAFAPRTVPNPAAKIVNYDVPPPLAQTVSSQAPMHLSLHLRQSAFLILNLRSYPAWQVFRNGNERLRSISRDDGLLAVPLPAGDSVLDLRWHRTPDVLAGDALSCISLLVLVGAVVRSRKMVGTDR